MRRLTLTAVLALLSVFLALPISNAVAGEKIWQATLSGSYQDVDDVGEIASAVGEVLAPLSENLLLGPAVGFTYLKLDTTGQSVTGVGWGGSSEWDFNPGSTFVWFGRINALYFTGEADIDWSGAIGAGLKVGDSNTFLKITAQRSKLHGTGVAGDTDSTDILIGIGVRL